MKHVNILMIDDHPSQIEGYKGILSFNEVGYDIETMACYDCRSAYDVITSGQLSNEFDIIFIDKSMPPYPEKNIASGEDLALLIKMQFPEMKVVIITSYNDAFQLYNIVKKIEPIGLLVKSDFHPDELIEAFDCIMNGGCYYTSTVKMSIDKLLQSQDYLDSKNRQMIMLLSQGVKTKSLPDFLHISLSAVEKRKAFIKDYLCLGKKGSDEEIVSEARKRGFI